MKSVKFILKMIIVLLIVVLFDFIFGSLYKHLTRPPQMFYTDERIGLRHISNIDKSSNWPESHKGSVIFKTNNLGFRENKDTQVKKNKSNRYMVFGDSHTDGVVDNELSFPNLTENHLNLENSDFVEIINAASGHSSIYQQSLHLEEWLHLKPDKVIFVFYTGNDYLEMLWKFIPHPDLNERGQLIALPAEDQPADWVSYSIVLRLIRRFDHSVKMQAEKINRYAVWQSLSQAYYFKEHPVEFEQSSRLHDASIKKIKRLSTQNNFELLFLILPTKYQIEPDTDSSSFRRLEQLYGLSPNEKTDDRVRRDFLALLRQNEISYLDLYDSLLTASQEKPANPLYWNSDHHLSESGHAVVARIWTDYEIRKVAEWNQSIDRKQE